MTFGISSCTTYELVDFLSLNHTRPPSQCVGLAPSQGRKCFNPIAQDNQYEAGKLIKKIQKQKSVNLEGDLKKLAALCLCRRNHQNQTEHVAEQWREHLDRDPILEFDTASPRVTTTEIRARPRDALSVQPLIDTSTNNMARTVEQIQREQITRLNQQISAKDNSISRLEARLHESHCDLTRSEGKYRRLEQERETLSLNNEMFKVSKEILEATQQSLNEKLINDEQKFKQQLQSNAQTIENLRGEVVERADRVHRLETDLRRSQRRAAQHAEGRTLAEERITELRSEYIRLNEESDATRRRFEREVREAREKEIGLNNRIARLETECDESRQSEQQAVARTNHFETELNESRGKEAQIEAQLAHLAAELNARTIQLETAQREARDKDAESDAKIAQLEADLLSAQQKENSTNSRAIETGTSLRESLSREADLRARVPQSTTDIDESQAQGSAVTTHVTASDQAPSASRDKEKQTTATIQDLRNKEMEHIRTTTVLRKVLKQAREKEEQLGAEVSQKNTQVEDARARQEVVEARVEKLEKELAETKDLERELDEYADQLEVEVAEGKERERELRGQVQEMELKAEDLGKRVDGGCVVA